MLYYLVWLIITHRNVKFQVKERLQCFFRFWQSHLHGQVQELFCDVLIGPFQIPNKISSEVAILVSQQGVGHALLSCSPRAANSVGVGVNITGHVIIDHSLNGRNIQTTSWAQEMSGVKRVSQQFSYAFCIYHILSAKVEFTVLKTLSHSTTFNSRKASVNSWKQSSYPRHFLLMLACILKTVLQFQKRQLYYSLTENRFGCTELWLY